MSVPTNDAYGHTVSFSTDGASDYYLVGGAITYTFPAGTATGVALVSIAIQWNLQLAKQQTQDFIQSKYSRDQQIQLSMMYLAAQMGGLSNREAHIGQLLTWLNSIITYLASYVSSVQAMTNPIAIAATTVDMTQFPDDPLITILSAIQIQD